MDYSPLLPRSESPIELNDHSPIFGSVLDDIPNYFESEDENNKMKSSNGKKTSESKKSKLAMESQQNNSGKSKLFGRSLSKSKSVPESEYIEDVLFMGKKAGGGGKKSSPIEIKGSPGKNRDGLDNKGSSTAGSNHNHSSSRISFFKVLTRRNSSTNQGKHKKLQDHWIQAREPVLDGVTFCVKFLGSTLIEKTGASDAAEATKTVIQMVKAGQKSSRLALTVCTNGITLSDTATGEIRLEVSIYDIAHCSADANYPNVFSFIATNKNDVNECYCFATSKRKMAQHITLTIAQAFNLAFELWQTSSLENSHNAEEDEDYASKVIIGSTESAKSCSSSGSTGSGSFQDVIVSNHHRPWVHFDQEEKSGGSVDEIANSIRMVTLSPFHRNQGGQNGIRSRTIQPKNSLIDDEHSEDLLICLN